MYACVIGFCLPPKVWRNIRGNLFKFETMKIFIAQCVFLKSYTSMRQRFLNSFIRKYILILWLRYQKQFTKRPQISAHIR